MSTDQPYDVLIIGAGAAGLMCAQVAAQRGRRVLVVESNSKPGRKLRISGGGKCNFTNLDVSADNYQSANPHFCKSALARFSQWDFLDLLSSHGLSWEERDHGQLFCEQGAQAILDLLLQLCLENGVEFRFGTEIHAVDPLDGFRLHSPQGLLQAAHLVVATGGPSIPRIGASDFGLRIARQFGLKNIPFRPALVPLTFAPDFFQRFLKELAGISLEVAISCGGQRFREQLLITHRGISGPVVLQISSYWHKGDAISIDLLPSLQADEWLLQQQHSRPKAELKTILSEQLPKRLAQTLCSKLLTNRPIHQYSAAELQAAGRLLNGWNLYPSGTEGMRTAEACTGGISTEEISSRTFEAKKVPGLYFIGETVDVTGQLGGYNLQWAWSSGWCAGQFV